MVRIRLAVVTISDAASRGERTDQSGEAIAEWASERGHVLMDRVLISDDADAIRRPLEELAGRGDVDLVLTTGGTGFTARDNTPEATRSVLEREAPGVAEALRSEGARSTPMAWLSRGVAGIRGRTLIVNFPGSTGGVRDGLKVMDRLAAHAVQLLRGTETERHPDHG